MTPEKRPAWVADRNPASDRTKLARCKSCGQQVIRALVGRTAAHQARADPAPLDPLRELLARLDGRLTYCLSIRPHLPPRLLDRTPWHIKGGKCTHYVVTDHHCPGRPAEPVQEALL
ncbi:hypothetical protein [Kitasatospora sp. CB02891]|uniref:hypothetical protein n=1 Tax=Kitasatospora sp. CB02891 TaxID=2020329 RepID=UPI000C277268|nr:hypothetical protein [Kitasatospora sp. CB02891]PJN24037.1 hypothetical protein CG736_19255 [Kitasatospora sp. CB02891]